MAEKPLRIGWIDAFRGLAVAGMIVVNTPGSWQHVYRPLRHAGWHGCTPADLVFPFFLFIAGTSLAWSLAGRASPSQALRKTVRRCVLLFALGLALNCFGPALGCINGSPQAVFAGLRIMGVLQRISVALLAAGLTAVLLPVRWQPVLAAGILLGHWAALSLVPVPGYGAGDLSPAGNLASYLDRLVLSARHLYRGGPCDPEGLLGSLPSAVTVLGGYWTGQWMRTRSTVTGTSVLLLGAGSTALAAGWLWGLVFTVSKPLWTGPYVLYSAGWALTAAAVCHEIIEVRRYRAWALPFIVSGRNAIFAFAGSGIMTRIMLAVRLHGEAEPISLYAWTYRTLFVPSFGHMNGSLAFALICLFLWWLVLYGMYRRGLFVKI